MPFKIDFVEGDVLEWTTSAQGAEVTRIENYGPTIYVGVRDGDTDALDRVQNALDRDPKTVDVSRECWYADLRASDRSTILRIDLERIDEVTTTAREIQRRRSDWNLAPGVFQLYNVGFSREFRYCLETGTDPTPGAAPRRARALDRGEAPRRARYHRDP